MKYIKKIIITAAALFAAAFFFYTQNNTLTVEKYAIKLPQNSVNKSFDEKVSKDNDLDDTIINMDSSASTIDIPIETEKKSVKIVHLSDLHNKSFGKDQIKLLEQINDLQPDIILFTGDLIDSRRKGNENAMNLMKALSEIYPVYGILGNHDFSDQGFKIFSELEDTSVITLRNESKYITINGINITLRGVDDPIRYRRSIRQETYANAVGTNTNTNTNTYSILLAHRPEYFSLYEKSGYDLALSGHSHGGQIRLPLIGGLFAPHQGAFPKYDGGRYFSEENNNASKNADDAITAENSVLPEEDISKEDLSQEDLSKESISKESISKEDFSMIVSRGLGNSLFPLRIFNLPEIIFIELTE